MSILKVIIGSAKNTCTNIHCNAEDYLVFVLAWKFYHCLFFYFLYFYILWHSMFTTLMVNYKHLPQIDFTRGWAYWNRNRQKTDANWFDKQWFSYDNLTCIEINRKNVIVPWWIVLIISYGAIVAGSFCKYLPKSLVRNNFEYRLPDYGSSALPNELEGNPLFLTWCYTCRAHRSPRSFKEGEFLLSSIFQKTLDTVMSKDK